MNEKFKFLNGIEFSFYNIENILNTTTFSIIPFMIKTHSVCVFGKDVTVHLPKYKANKTLGNEDAEDILECCSWIMKILVRAGLALVIEEENLYTRDLFPAYELFSKHYPQQEEYMRQVVKYAINPIENPNEILKFLEGFGKWMVNESEKWLQVYNPEKVSNMEL